MECIISHDAEEAIGVFVGSPLEFSDGKIENVGRLCKNVEDRRRAQRRSPVGFDEKTVEGDFLHERAIVHGMVIEDRRADRDEAIELDNLWNKPVRTGESMKKE